MQMLHVTGVHYANSHFFLHEDRWINRAVMRFEKIDFSAIRASEWLIQNAAYTGGDIAFFALNADKNLA